LITSPEIILLKNINVLAKKAAIRGPLEPVIYVPYRLTPEPIIRIA
jgi:hypothetical protein